MTLRRLVDKKLHRYNPEEKVYVKGKYHKKKDIVFALRLAELVKEIKPQTYDIVIQSLETICDEEGAQQVKKLKSLLEEAKKK